MSTQENARAFNAYCARSDKYPLNLSQFHSNNGGLLAQRALLRESAPRLFKEKSEIAVIELGKTGQSVRSEPLETFHLDEELNQWLLLPNHDGSTPGSEVRCRFIFFKARSGQDLLDVSLGHTKKILTYFQVMPSYIDFISAFTIDQTDSTDISDLRFSSFRERVGLGDNRVGFNLPHLNLSGQGFQLSYNLKSVANTEKKQLNGAKVTAVDLRKCPYSTRQAAFHHQFDMKEGTTLWIITAARKDLQKRVQRLIGQKNAADNPDHNEEDLDPKESDRTFDSVQNSFIASLSVHLMLAQYSSEDWRGYLRWLEQKLENSTKDVLTDEKYNPREFDLMNVQVMEDRANRAAMTLNANAKVLVALANFYEGLMANKNFGLHDMPVCKSAIADFLTTLRDYIYDMEMYSERAELFAKLTADRKTLVQERLNKQASDRVEKLTVQQQREAKIMRVIALVTLIYLPATFVSTFFSTDVVKYQPDGDGSSSSSTTSYSSLALERWFEVTVPLTIVTFLVAVGWYYGYDHVKKAVNQWFKGGRPTHDLEKQLPK